MSLPASREQIAAAAYELRAKGLPMHKIAAGLGLTPDETRSAIHSTLSIARDLVNEGAARQVLALETDRLDTLQASYWDDALSGDIKAAELVLKIIEKRSKLLGLDAQQHNDTPAAVQTVVVSGDTNGYIAALRAIQSHSERRDEDG